MALVVVIALAIGIVAGVTEANRILNAVHAAEGAIHARIAALEEKFKEKL